MNQCELRFSHCLRLHPFILLITELPRPRRRLTQFLVDIDKNMPAQELPYHGKWCDFLFLRSPVRIWPRECTNGSMETENATTSSANSNDQMTSAGRSVIGKIELCVNRLQVSWNCIHFTMVHLFRSH